MKIVKSTANFTARLAAAGVMSAVLAVVPAAESVAHPAHPKHATVTAGIIKAAGGSAAVTVDPAIATGATALGITLAPIAPATAVGNVWTLPITAGRIAWMTRTPVVGTPVTRVLGGGLALGGGFSATKDATTVTVSDIVVHLEPGNGSKAEARINGSKRRLPALQVSDIAVTPATRSATATLGITRATAVLLNKALSTTSFKAGMKVGTVAVTVPAPA